VGVGVGVWVCGCVGVCVCVCVLCGGVLNFFLLTQVNQLRTYNLRTDSV
jgi:hypothetical protein